MDVILTETNKIHWEFHVVIIVQVISPVRNRNTLKIEIVKML